MKFVVEADLDGGRKSDLKIQNKISFLSVLERWSSRLESSNVEKSQWVSNQRD